MGRWGGGVEGERGEGEDGAEAEVEVRDPTWCTFDPACGLPRSSAL